MQASLDQKYKSLLTKQVPHLHEVATMYFGSILKSSFITQFLPTTYISQAFYHIPQTILFYTFLY
jgi:hypothetical protein